MDTSVTENAETVKLLHFSDVIISLKMYIVYIIQSTSYLSRLNKGWLRSLVWETGSSPP
jgi:hypothetical protein